MFRDIRWGALGLLAAVCVAAVVSAAAGPDVGAQVVQPPAVTDYAAYPDTVQAQLPVGCDGTGLIGVQYSLNGGAAVSSLAALGSLQAGDTILMTWTSVSAACAGSPVVLAVKDAQSPFFDINALQPLVSPYGLSNAEALSLTYVLPDLSGFGHGCNLQIDPIVGLPLAVVGKVPNGSFYSAATRGDLLRTTLVGQALNGSYGVCAPLETTTTTQVSTTVTPPPPPTTAPPTTVPATTTPTTAPPTTFVVTNPCTVPLLAACQTAASQPQGATPTSASRTLAATGTSGWMAPVVVGALLMSLGGYALTRKTRSA